MDVILVHDAAIDEYMSQLLLQTMPGINLLGAIIVNADCIDSAAMQTAWQVQSYIGNPDLPMGLSRARGWNAFPWSYRSDCVKMGQVPALSGVIRVGGSCGTSCGPGPEGSCTKSCKGSQSCSAACAGGKAICSCD